METKNDTTKLQEFKMDDDQKKAFALIESTNTSLFITGKAGTGKSTFIKMIQEKIDAFILRLPLRGDRTPYPDEGVGGEADSVEAYRHDHCG